MSRSLCLAFVILICSVFSSSHQALAYEFKSPFGRVICSTTTTGHIMPLNSAYQVFNDVDQVMVVLDVSDDQGFEIPESLKTEYLSEMLRAIYIERYEVRFDSLGEILAERNDRACYGRNGQSVFVVSFLTSEDKAKAKEQSLNEGTLTVYIQVKFPSSKTASVEVVHYRPHLNQPWWRRLLGMPMNFWDVEGQTYDFNMKKTSEEEKNEKLDYKLESYFIGKIL